MYARTQAVTQSRTHARIQSRTHVRMHARTYNPYTCIHMHTRTRMNLHVHAGNSNSHGTCVHSVSKQYSINVSFAQQSIVISQVRCSASLCLYSRAPSRLNSRAPGVACVWRTRLDLSCTQQEGRQGYDGMHGREKMLYSVHRIPLSLSIKLHSPFCREVTKCLLVLPTPCMWRRTEL